MITTQNRLLWVDLETTGLNEFQHHIVQIAAIAEYGDKIEEFEILINPPILPMDYDIGAGRITGLTKEQLEKKGVSPVEAFRKFVDFLSKYIKPNSQKDKFFISGKNVVFDRRFLEIFFEQHNDSFIKYFYPLELNIDSLIAFLVSKKIIEIQNFKEVTIANILGIKLENAHDAISDIRTARQIFYKSLKLIQELPKFNS